MPHAHSSSAASSGGDDLGSTDEVKVFKDEGDGEDEKRSSENLLEEKSSLIDWTESELITSPYGQTDKPSKKSQITRKTNTKQPQQPRRNCNQNKNIETAGAEFKKRTVGARSSDPLAHTGTSACVTRTENAENCRATPNAKSRIR
ncbi:hypothetical protein JYU34_019947 [Plutella xylostella]|uniref:CTNNB1 binding N-teminal domain-containing protein n=1 Tax=Plutella xylostella TaxID=51655 RepID=A0ABQ7PVL5_PLUXY|nr:hypothetical protein JYU34_019947 [Plutella xylostella]